METMQKATTLAFSTTPTHPKDASVGVYIVTKVTVGSVASIMQHMTANWGGGESLLQRVLCEIHISTC